MPIVKMIAGRRRLEVDQRKVGRKIHFRFRNYAPLREEIKCMRGAEWRHDEKEWAVTDCARNQMQLAMLRGEKVPEIERYYAKRPDVTPNRGELYSHQLEMLRDLLWCKRYILAAQMRTGKTLAVIEGMEKVGGRWLYVAPARVLTAIELEFDKWNAGVRPTFSSYAGLRKTLELWEGPTVNGVVFDESSRLKTPGAQRTKAAQHVANAVRRDTDGYVWLLTGTPAPKNPTDWWAQAEIACPGFLRESTRSHLERRLAVIERMEIGDKVFGKVVDWKEDQVELLGERLKGLVGVYFARDCYDLPELQFQEINLKVSDETRDTARLIAQSSESALETLNKLSQLSDGFLYTDGDPAICHTPKDLALLDLLAAHDEVGRLIVYARFKASIDKVTALCKTAGWQVLQCDGRGWIPPEGMTAKEALKEMGGSTNTGTVEKLVLVGNPLSVGMGTNLAASPGSVYYSMDHNGESRMQSLERGHSPDMDVERGHTIYDLLHLPTDRLVLDSHARKKELQSLTMEEIRAVL